MPDSHNPKPETTVFPDYPPRVAVPTNLSDEAAAELLEFLYEITRIFENHYAAQIRRHYQTIDESQNNPSFDQDPPF